MNNYKLSKPRLPAVHRYGARTLVGTLAICLIGFIGVMSGCDSNPTPNLRLDFRAYDYVGLQHNEGLDFMLDRLKSAGKRAGGLADITEMCSEYVQVTSVSSESGIGNILPDYCGQGVALGSGYAAASKSAGDSFLDGVIADLVSEGSASEAQIADLMELAAVVNKIAEPHEIAGEIESFRTGLQPYDGVELVLIVASVTEHSLLYWSSNTQAWLDALGIAGKAAKFSWSSFGQADATGAVVGAFAGARAGAIAGAGAGGVGAIPGALGGALGGAVAVGLGASAGYTIASWFD